MNKNIGDEYITRGVLGKLLRGMLVILLTCFWDNAKRGSIANSTIGFVCGF